MPNLASMEIGEGDLASDFRCRTPEHTAYFFDNALAFHHRGIARCFVLRGEGAELEVLGYYTLSMHSVDLHTLPEELSASVPFRKAPVALLGQLARDDRAPGDVGTRLLAEALARVAIASKTVGTLGVLLHTNAGWDRLVHWYEARGFTKIAPWPSATRSAAVLFMPMATLRAGLAAAGVQAE
jgi:hypothetical protein